MPPNPFTLKSVESALGGRFELGDELRVGGQGVVYRARRILTPDASKAHDDVALKLHSNPHEDIRAQREINAMEGNRHPHLAHLIEHGVVSIDSVPVRFAAWEFIEGQPLDHVLNSGRLEPRIVSIVGRDVARAIEHLWGRDRIVHRDVNPKNIMLRTGGREAVLIDLGAAKHLNQAPITAPLLTWGTVGYLSPEQAHANPNLTSASDVFSLGVTLQELLCGHHPTRRDQDMLIRGGVRTASICPSAPAALAGLIDRMLSTRAAFRPLPNAIAQECGALTTTL